MKKIVVFLFILTLAILSVSIFQPCVRAHLTGVPVLNAPYGTSIPNGSIDGTMGSEWNDAGAWKATSLGMQSNIRAKYDLTYLYMLLVIADNTSDPINPSNASEPHDWVGLEFDIDGDHHIHGTHSSADDWKMCDYKIPGGEDWSSNWFGNDFRRNDTSVGGTNDVVAAKGVVNSTHIAVEFKIEWNSGDVAGADIALDPSQTSVYGKDRIHYALSYQDGNTGMHYVHTDLYRLLVLGPLPTYTLTIHSSPTGVTFTANGTPHTTSWSQSYTAGTVVNLEMPATLPGYAWFHWSDSDTNRIKTLVITADTTLTGEFYLLIDPVVGGEATPINIPVTTLGSQTPSILLSTILLPVVVALIFIHLKKKRH